MAKVEFKVTAWEKVEIKDEHIEDVKRLIEAGEIQTAMDISNNYPEFLEAGSEYPEWVDDSQEQMIVEENNGYSTIQILNDSEEVYKNGK